MKIIFSFILFLSFAVSGFAQESSVYLKDGNILIERGGETRALDYSKKQKYANYHLKKWNVKEELNPVQEALQVYSKKSTPVYDKKIWIVDKRDGTKGIYVEYKTNNERDRIVFSPSEDHVFYLGLSPLADTSVLYGRNLLTQERFSLNNTDDFDLLNCPNKKSYVVVIEDGKVKTYHIYSLGGEKVDTISGVPSQRDLERYVCY